MMDATETILYLYQHGHIPKHEHKETILKEIIHLQAELAALRTENEKLKFALQTIAKTEGATVSNLKCVAEQALKD
jgi:cell shape-determining protein MreC